MKILLAACLLLVAAAVQADQPPADQQIVDHYCAKANTQADINQCAGDAASAADQELNATYQAVLKKWAAYPAMIDKLRLSQRQWLSYRDADLKARFAIEDAEGAGRGTAYPAAYAFYQASLERERTARLCEYLRGAAYGERDSAPCAELVKHPFVVPNTP
jgi:uncharacterized protein YecT (DUF1311 family)